MEKLICNIYCYSLNFKMYNWIECIYILSNKGCWGPRFYIGTVSSRTYHRFIKSYPNLDSIDNLTRNSLETYDHKLLKF